MHIFGTSFEKIIFNLLLEHLDDHNLLTSKETGFCPGDS